MKKFFYCPLWKIEKLEENLSNLEQMGWRLDRVSPINCFHFVKSSAKDSSYFFTYKLIRENGMADIEAAQRILCKRFSTKSRISRFQCAG